MTIGNDHNPVPEDEIAALKRRLAVVERDHKSFLERFYGPVEKTAITELEKTFALTMNAVDTRIAELAARTGGGGPPEDALAGIADLFRLNYALIGGITANARTDAGSLGTLAGQFERVTDHQGKILDTVSKLCDRVRKIENILVNGLSHAATPEPEERNHGPV